MAQASQTQSTQRDGRFFYEPMLAAHPQGRGPATSFLNFSFSMPLWISSMTGGTSQARTINHNMARACAEFDLGMGLGSCRPLLENRQALEDFDVRSLMPGRPLYANLGVAQVEELGRSGRWSEIHGLVESLRADGLIIHVNPLQEFFQPGGDLFFAPPIETIAEFLDEASYPIIVKEVGHGMGPLSLQALMRLPLAAIEFAAFGGTNFSILEAARAAETEQGLAYVGHSSEEMIGFVQKIIAEDAANIRCQSFIISGGVRDVLQGHHLTGLLPGMSLFGMAASVLQHARGDYSTLRSWLENQISHYRMAQAYLRSTTSQKDSL